MRKILPLVLLAAVMTTPASAAETIKLSAPPSIWVQDQNGRLTGPIIDLLKDLFMEMQVDVQAEALPWARAISHLKSGELDMIPVIFHTPERAAHMVFSVPYIEVPTAIFVPLEKGFAFRTVEDLVGRRGVMMRGDSISPAFEACRSKLDITPLSSYAQMVRMLVNHRAEYAVAAQFGLLIEAKKLGHDRQIEVLPEPVAIRNLHIAFSKKSRYLEYLPAVNQRLRRMKREGTLKKVVEEVIRMATQR